jgi:fibronectin type 3 domain-containing protein
MTVTATGATNTPQTISVTLTLGAPTTSSATISWNPNTEPDLVSYRIYISTTQGIYGAPAATVQQPTTSYIATGLNIGNTYYFTVTAVDSAGNESAHSNEVSKVIL